MKYSQKFLDEVRSKIPDIAFELYAKKGIEYVSMQNLADEVGLGFTTMYRYYGQKRVLVIEVATKKWTEYANLVEKKYKKLNGEQFSARQEVEFLLDAYIDLYMYHKNLLKFNRNFDVYVIEERPTVQQMQPYYNAIKYFNDKFHNAIIKAKNDHSIRTDLSEEKIFNALIASMLSVASKYAHGVVYPITRKEDHTEELQVLKEAYLSYLTQGL